MKNKLFYLCLFLCTLYFSGQAQEISSCKDSSNYITFRTKWNNKVSIFKEASWKLPVIDFSKQKRDSFEMVQALIRTGLTFMSTITKTGCIKKVSLVVKKDESIEVQGLVATLYLSELFNHEAGSAERQKIIDEVKAEALKNKTIVSKKLGKNTYIFEPGMVVNVFTITLGN